MKLKLALAVLVVLSISLLPSCTGVVPEEEEKGKVEVEAIERAIGLETEKPESEMQIQEIELGQAFTAEGFEYTPVLMGMDKHVYTGPTAGAGFALFEANSGYKWVWLKTVVRNVGTEAKTPPFYKKDGGFKVKVDNGDIYEDIQQVESLGLANERYLGSATEEDQEKFVNLRSYVFKLEPGADGTMVKAFEVPEDTGPVEFSFQLDGEIEKVTIKLK